MSFRVYQADRATAIQSDPRNCLVAKGILRNKDVLDVWIGSGIDAYVVFKATRDEPAHAVHFGANAKLRRAVDKFDRAGKGIKSQDILLKRPPHSWRLDVRSVSGKRRREEIKGGSPIKRRGTPTARRITRLGVTHRPRAPISSDGSVHTEALNIA